MDLPLNQTHPSALVDNRVQFLTSSVTTIIVIVSAAFILAASYYGLKLLIIPLGLIGWFLLTQFPEIALGCLMVVGTFKGAPQLEGSLIDLTVVLVLVLVWSMGRAFSKDSSIPLPREFVFYVPILFMMILSLLYTPNLSGGIDKTARFFIICGVAILGPFAVLTTPVRLKRFFWTLLMAGMIASEVSLPMLGGRERLTTPGGDTIQLGHGAAVGIAIVWFGLMPGQKLMVRLILYGCIAVLAVALVGSGSRGPIIGIGAVILISIWHRRHVGFTVPQLLFDFAFLVGMGILLLPFIPIPEESTNYLGQLLTFKNATTFLGPRAGLLQLGWKLTLEHPLTGVGIGGFPTLYTGIGNWPHSIPLELGSELGLIAALSFCCLVFVALMTAFKEFVSEDESSQSLRNLMFCFVVIVTISMLNTGNLNDNRQLWTALSLPFLLRAARVAGTPG
jgi:O-antigen ligase